MIFIFLVLIIAVAAYVFLRSDRFGAPVSGSVQENISNSPNFRNGQFQNLSFTPDLTEGATYLTVMREFLLVHKPRKKPSGPLPSVKTDLHALPNDENALMWFGHSSYFLQIDGKKILVDPVLSGAASPVPATTRSFAGTDIYSAVDIPDIDYLFISHDHWDHLDFSTVKQLQPRVKKVICGLGVGAHLRKWGYASETIIERDWNEEIDLGEGFEVHTTTARHFSGRGLKRNQSLWLSFVLITPSQKIFLGGDSGYDTHFKDIGHKYGPFDLAIIECGQYDKSWKYIHMLPDEGAQAAADLKASKLLPVHWAKFSLANHSWDNPIKEISAAARKLGIPILSPMIGEKVWLDKPQQFTEWWKGL